LALAQGGGKTQLKIAKGETMRKACLISVVCLLLASLALAQTKPGRTRPSGIRIATTCGADPVLPSDGTVNLEDFIGAATTAYYNLNVKGGHSYSVEVWDAVDPTAGVVPAIQLLASNCSTQVQSTNVTSVDPDLSGGFAGRISWIQASAASIHIALNNPDQANGYTFVIRVTDTTLFNPRWSTYSGYSTSWGLTNTTPTDLNGTMTVYDSTGSVLATHATTLKAAQPNFLDTGGLGVPNNHAGYAGFAYIGPPGAIVGDGFMIAPSGNPIIPVLFETKHSYR
jgi:hypothetical protein